MTAAEQGVGGTPPIHQGVGGSPPIHQGVGGSRPTKEHAWDRWTPLWDWLFYLSLGLPTLLTVLGGEGAGNSRLVTVAIAAGFAVWHWAMVVAHPQWWGRIVPAVVYLAGAGASVWTLSGRSDAYFLLLYGLIPQIMTMANSYWLSAAGIAVVIALQIFPRDDWPAALADRGSLLTLGGSVVLAIGVGVFIDAITRQSEERHELAKERDALFRAGAAAGAARTPQAVLTAVGDHLDLAEVDQLVLPLSTVSWQRDGIPPVKAVLEPPASNEPADLDPGPYGARAAMLIPLRGKGANRLLVLSHDAMAFSEATRRKLATIATPVGLALENLRLAEVARATGVLEERQRLAREIHDTVAQGLTSIVTQLEAAEQAMQTDALALARHLDLARRTARESLTGVRRSVEDLRPELLEGSSLPQALSRVVDRWAAETGIPARTITTGIPYRLPPDAEVTLLRAAQEALANTRRHARASAVEVTLSYMEDQTTLDVHDDGAGFDMSDASAARGGLGLAGMRERVSLLGGKLVVESAAGEGTTVMATLPSGSAAVR